eukprot:14638357-Ditylum_brightwellii.AAC.1
MQYALVLQRAHGKKLYKLGALQLGLGYQPNLLKNIYKETCPYQGALTTTAQNLRSTQIVADQNAEDEEQLLES